MERPLRHLAVAACALAALAGLAGCGGSKKSAAATTTAAPAAEAAPGCTRVGEPTAASVGKLRKPRHGLSGAHAYTATIETNCGTIVVALDSKRAPRTAGSFANLAEHHFYDGTTFYRVAGGFVIQAGRNSPDAPYSTVEKPPGDLRYLRGVVAMTKADIEKPGTGTGDFFIVTAPDARLPADYALIGKVTSGMDVADRIGAIATDPPTDGRPVQTVAIQKVTITQR